MLERPGARVHFPFLGIVFLNAVAFGSVCPLLYFLFAYPVWIGVLIAVDSAGRIIGRLLFHQRNSQLPQTCIVTGSYILLVLAGYSAGNHAVSITLVYVWCFFAAVGGSFHSSIRFLISPQSAGEDRAGPIVLAGFATGCALTAVGKDFHLVNAMVDSNALARPAWVSLAFVGAASVVAAVFRNRPVQLRQSIQPSGSKLIVMSLMIETAFAICLCVVPLMARETYVFTPVKLAELMTFAAGLSAATQLVIRKRQQSPALIWLGLLLICVGFSGFILSSRLSRFHGHFTGIGPGLVMLWSTIAITATGHGLLQKFLSGSLKDSDENSDKIEPTIFPDRAADLRCMITALAAIIATEIWPNRETTSYALPLLLAITAVALSVGKQKSKFQNQRLPIN